MLLQACFIVDGMFGTEASKKHGRKKGCWEACFSWGSGAFIHLSFGSLPKRKAAVTLKER